MDNDVGWGKIRHLTLDSLKRKIAYFG